MTFTGINLSPQELVQLLSAFRSTALVIMRGDAILMKAGGLSNHGFQAFSAVLQRYWHFSAPEEINRYVGVSIDQRFCFLHAKFIGQREYLLGLMFPLDTALSQIRQNMGEIQRIIQDNVQKVSVSEDSLEQSLQSNFMPDPVPDPDSSAQPAGTGWSLEIDQSSKNKKDEPVSNQPINPLFNDDNHTFNLKEHLHNAGLPADHEKTDKTSHNPEMLMDEDIPWQPVDLMFADAVELNHRDAEIPSGGVAQKPVEDTPINDQNNTWQSLIELPQTKDDLASILQHDFEVNQDSPDGEEMPLSPFYGLNVKDEGKSMQQKRELEMASQGLSEEKVDITVCDVTFYLVPRVDDHQLQGNVAVRLRSWLTTICETYGWQLDDLSVLPNYVKWTLCDFPKTIIHEMLQIIRSDTSKNIYREFPEFQQDNQDNDFWSPGYLVDMQNREISSQALLSHLSNSRLEDETP